jgi:hypothetical protein
MVSTFGAPKVNPEAAFEKSFKGIIGPGTVYLNPLLTGVDLRKEFLEKTRGLTTDSSAFYPVWPLPGVFDYINKTAPLYGLIPKRAINTRTYDFNLMSATGTNASRFLLEGGTLVNVDTTTERGSKAVKFIYTPGSISGPATTATNWLADPAAEDKREKLLAHQLFQDNALINADHTSTTVPYGNGSYACSYYGIADQMSTTNGVNASSAVITLDNIRLMLQYAKVDGGLPTIGVSDAATIDTIKGLLMDYQRYVPAAQITAGVEGFSFDGLPIIYDQFMPTGSNVKKLFALDLRSWEVGVLSDIVYEELGKTADQLDYFLKSYEVVVCKGASFNGQVYGIA